VIDQLGLTADPFTSSGRNGPAASDVVEYPLRWSLLRRKIATLAAVGALALGSVAASDADARSRDRNNAGAPVVAGIVGFAAGAALAGAASQAQAAPAYGYGYPAYGYGGYADPVLSEYGPTYRPARSRYTSRGYGTYPYTQSPYYARQSIRARRTPP
jgi:hypothetical protein